MAILSNPKWNGLTQKEAHTLRESGRHLNFAESLEVRFWETIETMEVDETGYPRKPEVISAPTLTCEERDGHCGAV